MNEELHCGEELNQPTPPEHEGKDCYDEDDPCQSDLEAVS